MSPTGSGFTPLQNPLRAFGRASERTARIAARREFVTMKQSYLAAVADIAGSTGAMLQHKVRGASEPWELWSVRAVILASLPAGHARTPEHRNNLQGELEAVFDRPAR